MLYPIEKPIWKEIRSVKKLKATLEETIELMREQGITDLANNWTARLANIPKKMSKESINVILLAACTELRRTLSTLSINPNQPPTGETND